MRGARLVTVWHHQILRLPRNSEFKMSAENPWIASANIKTIRAWSEHIIRTYPKIKSSSRTRCFGDLTRPILETHFVWKNTTSRAPAIYQNFTKCCACHKKWHSTFTKFCACHAKWISWLICIRYETSFRMRGATRVTLQLHQILRLPRKSHSHDSSSSHMKRHLQCAEQHWLPSNITKYCVCHEILSSRCQPSAENPWIASANIKTIRAWSEDKIVISHPPLRRPYSSHLGDAFCMEKYNISRSGYRLSIKISRNAAPATKSDTPPSPNTAPAKQNESHEWSASDMKRHVQCAEQQESPSNCTKYCACHAKSLSW